jgi:HD-like signal output (HDOD) protein
MITTNIINSYIEKIPPSPKVLQETIALLNADELVQAAKVASTDMAFCSYIKTLVNKPIYGFRKEIDDINQIFSLLGTAGALQAIYNYMLTLLSPKKWKLFTLNQLSFEELQAQLSGKWNRVLKHLNIVDKDIQIAISLLPASIIVTEAMFKDHIEKVNLLKETKNLDYNTILKRLCNKDLFDICNEISKKWEMPIKTSKIIQAASGIKQFEDEEINNIAKWMHLLLFYELSQPMFIKAGLNDFIDFQIDYVSDIYDDFAPLCQKDAK